MLEKLRRRTAETADTVWIDPQGYQARVQERESAFQAELARQTK
jgi:hypothetical protein